MNEQPSGSNMMKWFTYWLLLMAGVFGIILFVAMVR